jgi:hypothetical protein
MRRANPNGGRAPGLRALTVDQGTTELHSLNRGPFLIWQCCFGGIRFARVSLMDSKITTQAQTFPHKRMRIRRATAAGAQDVDSSGG